MSPWQAYRESNWEKQFEYSFGQVDFVNQQFVFTGNFLHSSLGAFGERTCGLDRSPLAGLTELTEDFAEPCSNMTWDYCESV